MRKLTLFMHLSLDGYCATADGALNWIPYDQSFQAYTDKIMQTVGSPVYGRVTYELMKSYWPQALKDPASTDHDRAHATWLDGVEKIVVSTTLSQETEDREWKNTRVIGANVAEEFKKLKQGEGKDLVIFGSATLARSLMDAGLIDEFQFTISPVILGAGKTFIRSIEKTVKLELVSSEQIKNGVMGVWYRVVR